MANLKGNESSLVKYKPKWRSGKTRTIRVPIAIADLVLEAAEEIDKNGNVSLLQVIEKIKAENKQLKNKSHLTTCNSDRNRKIYILDGLEKEIYQVSTETSERPSAELDSAACEASESDLISDSEIAEKIGCDRSTIGKLRRKLLKGQTPRSKYLDRLKSFQVVEKGWIKITDTSE